ncbi:MAG: D-alanine--D-alanine ligase [Gammaproteobacteria bacterium SG8_47]|nr:MAG: D-alanine--D-alanine ligase [Gammaproteobacteria bacterium SG8_47]
MMAHQPSQFGRVAVLMGGWSAEREVSLKSGAAVLAALQSRRVDAHAVDVDRDIAAVMTQGRFERAFIALHGRGGEDGVVQGVLETLNIPYTGSGVMASALAMNKLATKRVLAGAGLPTPEYRVIDEHTRWDELCSELGSRIMVKPAHEGSSIGMSKVESAAQLDIAWREAQRFDSVVIAEKWIDGEEYTAAILGDDALPLIRLETPRTFYDYQAKYLADDTRYHCPCGLSPADEQSVQRLAQRAFSAVEGHGWGRVDLFRDHDDQAWIIEINTVPGLTDHSLVPMAARASGIEFDELVWRILEQTIPVEDVRKH